MNVTRNKLLLHKYQCNTLLIVMYKRGQNRILIMDAQGVNTPGFYLCSLPGIMQSTC